MKIRFHKKESVVRLIDATTYKSNHFIYRREWTEKKIVYFKFPLLFVKIKKFLVDYV